MSLSGYSVTKLRFKRILKQILGIEPWIYPRVESPKEFYGSEYEGWCLAPVNLDQHSVVYSFGVGQDISFDVSLIEKYGLTVHAFDPTPESIHWIDQQKQLPDQFHFHPYGIADYDGTAQFFPKRKKSNTCYSIVDRDRMAGSAISVPVFRFSTIQKKLGHNKISILKMDIEGLEYNVVNDMLRNELNVDQVLIEFHHRFKKISTKLTKRAVRKLEKKGFKLFYVSLKGREYSFIHQSLLSY